jgi:hypothetical protein
MPHSTSAISSIRFSRKERLVTTQVRFFSACLPVPDRLCHALCCSRLDTRKSDCNTTGKSLVLQCVERNVFLPPRVSDSPPPPPLKSRRRVLIHKHTGQGVKIGDLNLAARTCSDARRASVVLRPCLNARTCSHVGCMRVPTPTQHYAQSVCLCTDRICTTRWIKQSRAARRACVCVASCCSDGDCFLLFYVQNIFSAFGFSFGTVTEVSLRPFFHWGNSTAIGSRKKPTSSSRSCGDQAITICWHQSNQFAVSCWHDVTVYVC